MTSQTWKSLLKIGLAVVMAAGSALTVQAAETFRMPREGSDKAFLDPQPWSGYWWSRQETGMIKIMEKYDAFVQKRTGSNPGAAAWERNPRNDHYDPNGPSWAGHCNGWAAASILEPEPKAPRTIHGTTFSIGDQKGLLSEMYMDCYTEFYGQRKNDNFPFSLDIRPDLFHRLLVENIKMKKRGIVADISFNAPVWNYSVCGYSSFWQPGGFFSRDSIKVTTTVYFADDNVKTNFVGTQYLKKTYNYLLTLNRRGEIVGGRWTLASLWNHPDFVWIPIADMPAKGNGENPRLDPKLVHEITRGRPSGRDEGAADGMASLMGATGAIDNPHDAILTEAGVDLEEYFD